MQQAHQSSWRNYNVEHHYAHRERKVRRHSLSDVLGAVLGHTYPEEALTWVLYATQFTRHLDIHGYVQFRNWRFYEEEGLSGEVVLVWVYEGKLKIEDQTTALVLYSIAFQSDQQQLAEVKQAHRIETHFRSPRLDLWLLSEAEWLLALRRPEPVALKKPGNVVVMVEQFLLQECTVTGELT